MELLSKLLAATYAPLTLILAISFGQVNRKLTRVSQQIVDQASILLPTATILYASFSFTLAPLPRRLLSGSLSLASVLLVSYHAIYHSQRIFGLVFLALVFVIVARCMVLLSRVTDEKVKRDMRSLALFGGRKFCLEGVIKRVVNFWSGLTKDIVLFVGGSIAFDIDRNHCAQLRAMREVVGLPWGVVLEMHGWWVTPFSSILFQAIRRTKEWVADGIDDFQNRWHIGSGLGVYYFIVLIEYLRLYLSKSTAVTGGAEITMEWKSLFSIPKIEVQDTKTE